MQHPDEGTIHSWLDGALSADEAARVEAHVKDCPECAVAVAEARGFIAAASRILTALDNAPRGVIPAAAPKKRIDPIVWRRRCSSLRVERLRCSKAADVKRRFLM
jgi:anti-sigma factor RsiW